MCHFKENDMDIDEQTKLLQHRDALDAIEVMLEDITLPYEMVAQQVSLGIAKAQIRDVSRKIRSMSYRGPERRHRGGE
jgi:hypothetical protein